MGIARRLHRMRTASLNVAGMSDAPERQLLALGTLLSEVVNSKRRIASLHEVEFSIFSQSGDDGIVQWLVSNIGMVSDTFIEFGVGDYRESTTRFLLMHNNWSGLVMDSSGRNIDRIQDSEYFWKYTLLAKTAFVDPDNVNELLLTSELGSDIGILHIDVDGNEYWILKAICSIIPEILIVEYNSVFGIDRAISVPYKKDFSRTKAHYSNLYFGVSLRALHMLCEEKGYAFVGCNSTGNNAYFVRRDRLNDAVREVSLEEGYVTSKIRESRDRHGRLTYLAGRSRLEAMRRMPVYNVDTDEIEEL
jgi:hypothetical protein